MLIHFSGSASQVESAFGVGLDRIRLADGSIGRARTAAIRLPASIAGLVTSVVGLDNLVRLHPRPSRSVEVAARQPCRREDDDVPASGRIADAVRGRQDAAERSTAA